MAQNFSTKDFFRQMPNALLARYFHAKGLMAELDFSAMKQAKPDLIGKHPKPTVKADDF